MSPVPRHRRPSEARWLSDLSAPQQEALRRFADGTVTNCHGPKGAGIGRSTSDALLRGGLVEQGTNAKGEAVWRATARGAEVLRRAEPRLLARRSDALYATELADAWSGGDGDPGEGVDEATLEVFALEAERAAQHRAADADERLVRRLAQLRDQRRELLRVGFERGLDLRSELRVIDRATAGVERKIREAAAQRRAA